MADSDSDAFESADEEVEEKKQKKGEANHLKDKKYEIFKKIPARNIFFGF